MLKLSQCLQGMKVYLDDLAEMDIICVDNHMVAEPCKREPSFQIQEDGTHHKSPKQWGIFGSLFDAPTCGDMTNEFFLKGIHYL